MAATTTTGRHTRESLAADLRRLGWASGDTVFIHSSFKSLGPVDGGAATVIAAMEDVVGPEGLLLMPSFNLKADDRQASWDIDKQPASTGWLTEFFRQLPGTHRSDHFSHSVAARGKDAEAFVADHLRSDGPLRAADEAAGRWGAAYGRYSPFYKAYERDARYVFLGTDWRTATFCHFVETLWFTRQWRGNPDAVCEQIFREGAGAWYEANAPVTIGKVGDATTRVMRLQHFVQTLLEAVVDRPHRFVNVWEGKTQGIRRVRAGETLALGELAQPVEDFRLAVGGAGDVLAAGRAGEQLHVWRGTFADGQLTLVPEDTRKWAGGHVVLRTPLDELRLMAVERGVINIHLTQSGRQLTVARDGPLATQLGGPILASAQSFDEQVIVCYRRDAGICARVLEPLLSRSAEAYEFAIEIETPVALVEVSARRLLAVHLAGRQLRGTWLTLW